MCTAAWGGFVYNACRFTHGNTPVTHPSRQVLRQRLRQLILMRETGPKRPAWHLRRMQLIWGLHDALAALDGGLTPEFPQTLLAYGADQSGAFRTQLDDFCSFPAGDVATINSTAEWIARWGRQRNWELMRWKESNTPDAIAFSILGKGGPRIVLVGQHGPVDVLARAGIVTALTAMAALEECGGLGDVGCITLLSTGDYDGLQRALAELRARHDCILILGAQADGGFGGAATDPITSVLRDSAAPLGIVPLSVRALPALIDISAGLPMLQGFGPLLTTDDDRRIASAIALLALVCARLRPAITHT